MGEHRKSELPPRDGDTTRQASFRWVRAQGWSMYPTLLPGDEVEVGGDGRVSSQDLVAFLDHGGRPVVHRVLGRSASTDQLLVGGDGQLGVDCPVPRAAVIGTVIRVRRRLFGRYRELPEVLWRRRHIPRRVARLTKPFFQRVALPLARFVVW